MYVVFGVADLEHSGPEQRASPTNNIAATSDELPLQTPVLRYYSRRGNIGFTDHGHVENILSASINGLMTDEYWFTLQEWRLTELTMRESMNSFKAFERDPRVSTELPVDTFTGKPADICVICQQCFERNDGVANLACTHTLHYSCMAEWVKYKAECPVCRRCIPVHCKS